MTLQKLAPWPGSQEVHWAFDNTYGDRSKFLNRENVTFIGEVCDNNADYSFDDWALFEYEGRFYMFNASGCSCPSHAETSSLVYEAKTIGALSRKMKKDVTEYGVPGRQWEEFEALFELAKTLEKK